MTLQQTQNDETLTVTIFGRAVAISAADLDKAAGVLALLTAHEPFQATEQQALRDAHDLVRELRNALATRGGGAS